MSYQKAAIGPSKGSGNTRATKIVSTQKKAIEIARKIAINQSSEMLVHGRNGRIRERSTYGKDNFPPRG